MNAYVPGFVKKVISTVKSVGGNTGLDPNFPYILDHDTGHSPLKCDLWTVYSGKHVSSFGEYESVTILVADIEPKSANALRTSIKRLKTIRHPYVLRYLADLEIGKQMFLAVERVRPLDYTLKEKLKKSPDFIMWFIYSLIVGIVHANLRDTAIYFTMAGELRLGGFEHSTLFLTEGNKAKMILPWTNDCFMLGNLMKEFLNPEFPSMIVEFIHSCISRDPSQRPDPFRWMEQNFEKLFKSNNLICISEKIDNISIMEPIMRERFFTNLNESNDFAAFSTNYFLADFYKYKVVPSLITLVSLHRDSRHPVSVEGVKLLLRCAVLFSPEEFQHSIQKILVSLLSDNDKSIRLAVFTSLHSIVDKLDDKIIRNELFSSLFSGLNDPSTSVRKEALRTSVHVCHKLSSRQINSDLLRSYARLQSDNDAEVRMITLVSLSKIIPSLDPHIVPKVLPHAIVKGLKDTFLPCRYNAVVTLISLKDMISPSDIAFIIIPNLSPLLVDKDNSIRTSATEASFSLLKRIQSHFDFSSQQVEICSSPRTNGIDLHSKISKLSTKLMNAALGSEFSKTESPEMVIAREKSNEHATKNVIEQYLPGNEIGDKVKMTSDEFYRKQQPISDQISAQDHQSEAFAELNPWTGTETSISPLTFPTHAFKSQGDPWTEQPSSIEHTREPLNRSYVISQINNKHDSSTASGPLVLGKSRNMNKQFLNCDF